MSSHTQRLDRYLFARLGIARHDSKLLLAQGRIRVNDAEATGADQQVDQFSRVMVDGTALPFVSPVYLKLHKPVGVLSATRDALHTTVIDLLEHPVRESLHLVGRLDRGRSGLVLLTNDGRWSRALMAPEAGVKKIYEVRVEKPLTQGMVDAFAEGMYFEYENILTQPALLEILENTLARVTLVEGRYHQIKRMFGRFRNPVLALHRLQIGMVSLPGDLLPGHSCPLSANEVSGSTHASLRTGREAAGRKES